MSSTSFIENTWWSALTRLWSSAISIISSICPAYTRWSPPIIGSSSEMGESMPSKWYILIRLPPLTWYKPASPNVIPICGLSEGTCNSTVYSPVDSNALSGALRSGKRRRMAMIDKMPIARQKRPGMVVVRMFIATPVFSS